MNPYSRSAPAGGARQRGAVLFVALMFLILLSLLAIVASNTSIMQERMTGGMRNSQMAQMGADTAVRATEFYIWSAPSSSTNLGCTDSGGQRPAFRCFRRNGRSLDARVGNFRTAKGQLDPGTDGAMYAPATDLTSVTESARLATRPRVLVTDLGEVLPAGTESMPHRGRKPTMSGSGGGIQPFFAYRITARSSGGSAAVVRSAESIFVSQIQPIPTPAP